MGKETEAQGGLSVLPNSQKQLLVSHLKKSNRGIKCFPCYLALSKTNSHPGAPTPPGTQAVLAEVGMNGQSSQTLI